MPTTPNRNWTYPAFRTKPYFLNIVTKRPNLNDFFNEIDADVDNALSPQDAGLEYSTYADLQSATNISSSLVGKLALVQEDTSYWRLDQVSPVNKWTMTSGENKTRANITWTIDPVNGDDDTGDGSVSNPFKSFSCLDLLPQKIIHEIKLKPKAGSYTYFPEVIDHKYEGNGRVVIDASAETFPVIAGPFTVDTVSDVGDQYLGNATAIDLKVTGTPAWDVDTYYPKFIHILTGSWASYCLPIFKNTADTIRTASDWYGFAPGDTFNIVDCPVVIDIPMGITLRGNGGGSFDFLSTAYRDAPSTPSFLMCGVKIRANRVKQKRTPFRIENLATIFSVCTFINEDIVSTEFNKSILAAKDGIINAQIIASDSFDVAALTDWYAFPFQVSLVEGSPRAADSPDIEIADSLIAMTTCRGSVWFITKPSYAGGGWFIYSLSGGIYSALSGQCYIGPLYIEQIGYNAPAIVLQGFGLLQISGTYIQKSGQPVECSLGIVNAQWLKGNTPGITATYALNIDKVSSFYITSDVTILGSVGAIDFVWSNIQEVAWSTTGNAYNDTAGSYVIAE